MVKVMCNDQLVYKVVIWVFFGISLWTEKVALNTTPRHTYSLTTFSFWELLELFSDLSTNKLRQSSCGCMVGDQIVSDTVVIHFVNPKDFNHVSLYPAICEGRQIELYIFKSTFIWHVHKSINSSKNSMYFW